MSNNGRYLEPVTSFEYVAWCDVMGASHAMNDNFRTARYRVFQFHGLVLKCRKTVKGVRIVPAGDGVFLTSIEFSKLFNFIVELFSRVRAVNEIKSSRGYDNLPFLIRCGVAWGEVAFGESAAALFSKGNLPVDKSYLSNIIVGAPAAKAHALESLAPALGVIVNSRVPTVNESEDTSMLHWTKEGSCVYHTIVHPYLERWKENAINSIELERIENHIRIARDYFLATV